MAAAAGETNEGAGRTWEAKRLAARESKSPLGGGRRAHYVQSHFAIYTIL